MEATDHRDAEIGAFYREIGERTHEAGAMISAEALAIWDAVVPLTRSTAFFEVKRR
jgi:hypothetical protein